MKTLRPGAWVKNRTDGRFGLVESVTSEEVLLWKDEAPEIQKVPLAEFPKKWSIFHGYKWKDMGEVPSWVVPGIHVKSKDSDGEFVVLGVRSRAWVMLEAVHTSPPFRWLTTRGAGAFVRDFYLLPSRFDRLAV